MKKLIVVLFAVCLGISSFAQDKPKKVSTKIKEVTVFLSGAQVSETGETSLSSGANTIIFENLTADMNPQTIQLKGEGDFTILSVVHQLNYLSGQEKTKDVLAIEDSIEKLQTKLAYQQAMQTVFTQEEVILLANKAIGGQDAGIKPTDLKEAMEYFRTRLIDIKTNQLDIAAKIQKLSTRIETLSNQLATLNAKQGQPTSEVVVSISADAATTAKFTLSYLVANAGWVPTYDLRAVDVNSPIELAYKGNVYQTTGRDWNNVKLTLCTGNPTQSGAKPVLNPWYLTFNYGYGYGNGGVVYDAVVVAESKPARAYDKEESDENFKSKTGADYTVVSENQTNIEFQISIPYTVPCDGKKYTVEVQKNSLPAIFEYYCAPKIDNDAFLVARVTGWEQYNIIPGEMNLFFEGTYVGKSYIDTRYTKDTLDFSLGRDKSISVTREKMKDLSSTKFLGANTKVTYTYEINVKNKKKQAISIVIEDQVPVTTDKDIEVETIDVSGGMADKDTGKVVWKFTLKAAESKKMTLGYSVKYPKDKNINL
ncbi:MAG: DUF4139 domain-containing protein [Bacteroidota bacterium]